MSKSECAWQFCSEGEGIERQRGSDVHICEATLATRHLPSDQRVMDPSLAVQKFARSASDSGRRAMPPRTVRQMHATVMYLCDLWCAAVNDNPIVSISGTEGTAICDSKPRDVAPPSIGPTYVFVLDRCASVRQELVGAGAGAGCDSDGVLRAQLLELYVLMTRLYLITGCLRDPVKCPWFDARLHADTLRSCVAAGLQVPTERSERPAVADIALAGAQVGVEASSVEHTVFCSREEKGKGGIAPIPTPTEGALLSVAHETLQLVSLACQLGGCLDSALRAMTTLPLPEPGLGQNNGVESSMRAVLCPLCLGDWHVPAVWADKAVRVSGGGDDDGCAWQLLLQIAGHLRNSNPAGALRALHSGSSSIDIEKEAKTAHWSESLFESQECMVEHCLRAALVSGLQLWRLLLINVSANRGESVPLADVALRLFTSVDVCEAAVVALGLPVSLSTTTPASAVEQNKDAGKLVTLRSRPCTSEEVRAALAVLQAADVDRGRHGTAGRPGSC